MTLINLVQTARANSLALLSRSTSYRSCKGDFADRLTSNFTVLVVTFTMMKHYLQ